MHILIAPDSFKDSLAAKDVAQSLKKGMTKIFPDAFFELVPMADGGEGTVESIISATNGRIVKVTAHDPLMRKTESFFGISGDGKTAIIEMAAASGIEKLKPEERNPWETSTYGTGELIKMALDEGCRKFLIGIGGSATNDAGAGMAMALGVKFLDAEGKEIKKGGGFLDKISKIDISEMDPRVRESELRVACDVTNPLTGEKGASRVYGPQKGADAEMVKKLDANLDYFAGLLKKELGKDVSEAPGAGAAGGLGAGLMAFLSADLVGGFEMAAGATGLEEKIKKADLVITGEGKIDEQTQNGKTAFGVAQMAKKYSKPVIAVAGTLKENANALYDMGFDVLMPVINKPMPLQEALYNAAVLLEDTGERIARLINLKI